MTVQHFTFGPADGVPAPVAPYSHATAHAGVLHVTGQMPLDPVTHTLPDGITAQTHQVMANLKRVVELCGGSWDCVFSVRAYITSIDLYADFNAAYETWFVDPMPARTCIAVTGLAVGALVEVDLRAALA